MRKILLIIFSVCVFAKAGFCDTSSLKVSVDQVPPIFPGQRFSINARITNAGTEPIKLIDSTQCPTGSQLISNNLDMLLTGGVCIDHFNLPDERWRKKILLGPGQSYECKVWVYDQVWLNDPLNLRSGNLIRFKLGLKEYPDSEAVWSEEINISVKKEELLPVKVKAVALPIALLSSVPILGVFPVHITIINTSNLPQNIGMEVRSPGVMTDNEVVHQAGYFGCFKCTFDDDPGVILKPGESYQCWRTLAVSEVKQNPLKYRVVIKTVGRLPVYSNPVFVFVLTKPVLGFILFAVIGLVLFFNYTRKK